MTWFRWLTTRPWGQRSWERGQHCMRPRTRMRPKILASRLGWPRVLNNTSLKIRLHAGTALLLAAREVQATAQSQWRGFPVSHISPTARTSSNEHVLIVLSLLCFTCNCTNIAADNSVILRSYPVDAHCCIMGTAIKQHPVPDRVKPSSVIFQHPGTLTLWRSGLIVRVPGCRKLQMTA